MSDTYPDIEGSTKQNYEELHRSTGERWKSMSDRVLEPVQLGRLDKDGQQAAIRLAQWMREQKDDEEAVAKFQPVPVEQPAPATKR